MCKRMSYRMLVLILFGLVITGCPTETPMDTTAPVAGSNGTLMISAVSATSANLSWSAASDEGDSKLFYKVVTASSITEIDTYEEIDLITGSNVLKDWTEDIYTLPLTSLSPGTTYSVNVAVKDESDNLTAYTPLQITTLPAPEEPVNPPDADAPVAGNSGTITASSVTATSAEISWTVATDNIDSVLSYKVVTASTAEAVDTIEEINAMTGSSVVKDWSDNITAASLYGLTADSTYYVNVGVKDGSGNLSAYIPLQVTTLPDPEEPVNPPDTDAPDAGNSGTITASSVTATSAEISWTAATDNIDSVLSYKVVTASTEEAVDTTEEINAMTGSSVVNDWSNNLTAASISGLTPDSTFYVNVVVKDGNGNMTAYNPVQVTTRQDTDAPVAGSSGMISASSVTATSAEINWTAATDNIDSVLSYKVVTASTADAVDTAEEINAMTGSSVVQDWSNNPTAASISGLSPDSTFYVNVAVKDGNGNMTAYIPVQVTTRQDTNAPVAGNSGMTSASSVTATSAEINWTAATDNIDSILSYKVVTASTAEAVDTAEEINAMTGSSVVKDWSDNLTTAPISGLIPKSTCYVNVAVKDGSGNLAAYTPVVVTTPPEKLYLFKTINSDGNLGGRTGADQIVSDYEKKPAGVTVTVAFLSVSASDQLCDIPKNYGFPTDLPIYGPDGTVKIADNWVDLMDGRIDAPLDTAGVLKGGLDESYWWSGSNSDGTAHSETCRGWTDNKRATGGKVGVSFQSSNSWISSTTHPGDDSWNFVLGLGY